MTRRRQLGSLVASLCSCVWPFLLCICESALLVVGSMKRKDHAFVSNTKGGVRQRLERDQAKERSLKHPSSLVEYVLSMWGWGLMSTPQLQLIMQKAKEDIYNATNGTLDMTDINRLSGIGASGAYQNNMLRDLNTALKAAPLQQALHRFRSLQTSASAWSSLMLPGTRCSDAPRCCWSRDCHTRRSSQVCLSPRSWEWRGLRHPPNQQQRLASDSRKRETSTNCQAYACAGVTKVLHAHQERSYATCVS